MNAQPRRPAAAPVQYRLLLQPVRSVGPRRDVGRLLKALLRSYGLRCVHIEVVGERVH